VVVLFSVLSVLSPNGNTTGTPLFLLYGTYANYRSYKKCGFRRKFPDVWVRHMSVTSEYLKRSNKIPF